MKIVGVSACPTGTAHTYMAKEAIEKEAKNRGYDVKIETQGSMGVEDQLTLEEIEKADAVVIFAISIGIEDEERFEQKEKLGKVITCDPGEAIRNIKTIFDKLELL